MILILGGGFNAAAMLLYYALTTMRRQTQILLCYGAAFFASLAAAPMLVKKMGILGGALSYTSVMGLLVILFFITAWRQYQKAAAGGQGNYERKN